MKYTMEDIARMCGVSRGTVNRAIYNKPGVNDETRQRILDMITEVGYFPDRSAQALVKGQSNVIGLVLHNMTNEFNIMTYEYVQQLCIENGYYLHFASSNSNPEQEAKNIQALIEYNVDGIIIFPIDRRGEMLRRLLAKNIPVVQILNILPDVAAHSVIVRESESTRMVVRNLVKLGHKRIVYIDAKFGQYLFNIQNGNGRYNRFVYGERIRGYLEGMSEAGLRVVRTDIPVFYEYSHTKDNAVGFVKKIMAEHNPTALVCYDDFTAIWMVTGLKKAGYRIPEDISVAGIDDVNTLRFIEPALSTVRVDYAEVVRQAGKILFEEIQKPGRLRQVELGSEYVERASVSVPKG